MRKEVVATFIFYHGDGSGISCSLLDYTGVERQGGTRQEKETRKERLGMPRVGNMGSSVNEKADSDFEPVFRIEVHHQ